ncbi:MAG: FN3 associated domain-containing protein [Candidatus Cryptobacteroides sp.]
MNVGDKISSSVTGKTYTITWVSDKVANAEVAFADTIDGEYFLKRHITPVYPKDDAPLPPVMKKQKQEKCNSDYKKFFDVYEAVRKGCGEEGACVPILDYFRSGPFYYTVYRKINAATLSLAEIAALPTKEKYTLLLRLVQGLMPLHALGVIHGDLKPDNILVQRDGDNWRIRLIDIDDCYIARQPKEPGAVLGTIEYYSPELFTYNKYTIEDWEDPEEMAYVKRMADDLTLKSDIFALGIIFCEFYGNARPISTDESNESIHEAAVKGRLELPPTVSCDAKISALIRKMLDGDHKLRPTLTQVGDDLRQILQNKLVAPEIQFETLDDGDDSYNCIINTYCDGTVYYTLDGTDPTVASAKYTSAVKVPKYTTVKAIIIDGKRRTEVVSKQAWVMRRHTPAPKIIVKGQSISIRLNEKSDLSTQIYYTLDGTNPTKSSTLYSEPISVSSEVRKIKAIAIGPKSIPSSIAEANVYPMRIIQPVIHFKFGTVSMESPQDCDIYYTLDDSTPTKESLKYTSPFEIADSTKFHVIAACINNEGRSSECSEIKRPSGIVMTRKK